MIQSTYKHCLFTTMRIHQRRRTFMQIAHLCTTTVFTQLNSPSGFGGNYIHKQCTMLVDMHISLSHWDLFRQLLLTLWIGEIFVGDPLSLQSTHTPLITVSLYATLTINDDIQQHYCSRRQEACFHRDAK